MEIKIRSKTHKNRFLYGDLLENSKATTLAIFMSGFSGSRELPLFNKAFSEFAQKGFGAIKFNFCNDSDDKVQKTNTLKIEELSFAVYIAELKNIIDTFGKKYSNLVLVGHSFGAVIAILFLAKHKKYSKNTKLVIWEQSHLPWKKVEMEGMPALNKKFFRELTSVDTLKVFQSLKKDSCIIAAEGSADKDARKYFAKVPNKKTSSFSVIKETDHYLGSRKAQKELFSKTFEFLVKR